MKIGLVSYECKNKDIEYNLSQIKKAMIENNGTSDILCFIYRWDIPLWRITMPAIAVKSYDAKIDSKKRITLRNALFEYFHVEEYNDGRIFWVYGPDRQDITIRGYNLCRILGCQCYGFGSHLRNFMWIISLGLHSFI